MSEPRSYRVEAVVLRHADWGEADRLLALYTRQRGKLRVVAKGARRIKSRKAGHLEPFTRVALQLARGRDLPIVTQAETMDAYLPLRDQLTRTGQAAYVVELLDRFTREDETENTAIFCLLVETLSRLASEADPWLAVRFYEMHLLDLLGFRPRLFACIQCGETIQPAAQFFSAAGGGVLCPKCGSGTATMLRMNLPGTWPVSMEALRFLRHFQRSGYAEAQRAKPTPEVREELEGLVQKYITYLLERELNSPGFIRQINKER